MGKDPPHQPQTNNMTSHTKVLGQSQDWVGSLRLLSQWPEQKGDPSNLEGPTLQGHL